MKLDRLRPKRNGSGWSTRGALLTVLHAMVAWGLYCLMEAELLSEPVLLTIVAIAVPITAYVLARSAESQEHSYKARSPKIAEKSGHD